LKQYVFVSRRLQERHHIMKYNLLFAQDMMLGEKYFLPAMFFDI